MSVSPLRKRRRKGNSNEMENLRRSWVKWKMREMKHVTLAPRSRSRDNGGDSAEIQTAKTRRTKFATRFFCTSKHGAASVQKSSFSRLVRSWLSAAEIRVSVWNARATCGASGNDHVGAGPKSLSGRSLKYLPFSYLVSTLFPSYLLSFFLFYHNVEKMSFSTSGV